MKLVYKILWLDDQIQNFQDDEVIESIENYLAEEGFKPEIIAVERQDDFFRFLDNSFDLILTDYHMEGMNGDLVVKEVRDKSIFTEILFYTAQADLKDPEQQKNILFLDRITFLETRGKSGSHQDIVEEEIKKLINLSIRKFQHIVTMRGMIMHETSSLDQKKVSLVTSFIQDYDSEFLGQPLFDSIEEHLNSKLKKMQKRRLKDLIKDHWLFSAIYKIQALSGILQYLEEDDFSNEYKEEIISIRNKFAHSVLLQDENGREYFKYGKDGLDFDENLCRKIRKDILKHSKNIDRLEQRLESLKRK